MSEEEKPITVNNQKMTQEEFKKYQEDLEKDKSKRLKEISEKNFKVLTRLQG